MISKEIGYQLLKMLEKEGLFKTKEFDWLYEDYREEEYVYKDEETMLAHRKQMEEVGYKTYNCGMKAWFSGDEITNPNSTFWKYEVDIPTATYGIRIDGLYKKLGKY